MTTCVAVWRDRADRQLVACGNDAHPDADFCTWHRDRHNGPTLLLHLDRADAVRVERPGATGR